MKVNYSKTKLMVINSDQNDTTPLQVNDTVIEVCRS